MVLIDGVKFACASCRAGHRSSKCGHVDRELIEVKKKGRPTTQCTHCRELRAKRSIHSKCVCAEKDGPRGREATILPNGVVDAAPGATTSFAVRAAPRAKATSTKANVATTSTTAATPPVRRTTLKRKAEERRREEEEEEEDEPGSPPPLPPPTRQRQRRAVSPCRRCGRDALCSCNIAVVQVDRTRQITVNHHVHHQAGEPVPRAQSPRAAPTASTPSNRARTESIPNHAEDQQPVQSESHRPEYRSNFSFGSNHSSRANGSHSERHHTEESSAYAGSQQQASSYEDQDQNFHRQSMHPQQDSHQYQHSPPQQLHYQQQQQQQRRQTQHQYEHGERSQHHQYVEEEAGAPHHHRVRHQEPYGQQQYRHSHYQIDRSQSFHPQQHYQSQIVYDNRPRFVVSSTFNERESLSDQSGPISSYSSTFCGSSLAPPSIAPSLSSSASSGSSVNNTFFSPPLYSNHPRQYYNASSERKPPTKSAPPYDDQIHPQQSHPDQEIEQERRYYQQQEQHTQIQSRDGTRSRSQQRQSEPITPQSQNERDHQTFHSFAFPTLSEGTLPPITATHSASPSFPPTFPNNSSAAPARPINRRSSSLFLPPHENGYDTTNTYLALSGGGMGRLYSMPTNHPSYGEDNGEENGNGIGTGERDFHQGEGQAIRRQSTPITSNGEVKGRFSPVYRHRSHPLHSSLRQHDEVEEGDRPRYQQSHSDQPVYHRRELKVDRHHSSPSQAPRRSASIQPQRHRDPAPMIHRHQSHDQPERQPSPDQHDNGCGDSMEHGIDHVNQHPEPKGQQDQLPDDGLHEERYTGVADSANEALLALPRPASNHALAPNLSNIVPLAPVSPSTDNTYPLDSPSYPVDKLNSHEDEMEEERSIHTHQLPPEQQHQ